MISIDIVIATYNGEKYLAEQLESIRQCDGYQEYVSRVIISDDGSTDNTFNIIKTYQQIDTKIELHSSNGDNLGPCLNFAQGLKLTSSPYIMLCDQDDIWRRDKITQSLEAIRKGGINDQQPFLIFSDVHIVDKHLNILAGSYFSHKRIDKSWIKSSDALLQQNVISGCTMMINQALLHQALPIPKEAYMHDWWLGLYASCFGQLYFIDEVLVKYRQHDANSIGAGNRRLRDWCFNSFAIVAQFRQSFELVLLQAKAFHKHTHYQYKSPTLLALCDFDSLSRWQRLRLILTGVLKRSHLLGNIGLLILALTKPVHRKELKN